MPPPGSESESDDDVDWSTLGSAFDTEETSSPQSVGFVDIAFWEGLHTQRDGPNTLGFIQDDQTLKGELKAVGLIFGMREKDGHWTYKSLSYSPGSRGVWEELVVPGDV